MAVEAKQGNDRLSAEQKQIHRILKVFGLPVYVLRPEDLESARKTPSKLALWTSAEFDNMKRSVEESMWRTEHFARELQILKENIENAAVLFDE